MKKIVIAIDGYSGTGKSSTAKQVASRLGYTYIDTGAMYRAITYHFLLQKVDLNHPHEIEQHLATCDVLLEGSSVFLNGNLVNNELRTIEVNQKVSEVSTISAVRSKLVEQQRRMGGGKGVVMDGRDIGTVVFPDAELKVFMTANMDIRTHRRLAELQEKGIDTSFDTVKENLMRRDAIDTSREDSPLEKALDAVEIDTSDLTLVEQVDEIVKLAKGKL